MKQKEHSVQQLDALLPEKTKRNFPFTCPANVSKIFSI